MERYLAGGGTLLLCSHSMYHVQKLCRNALWLKDGRVERYGPAADVTQAYLAYHEEKGARREASRSRPRMPRRPGVYAIADARARARRHRSRRATSCASAGEVYLAGRPRAGRADRHRARRRHAGVRRRAPTWTASRRGASPRDRFAFALTLPRVDALAGQVLRPRACARSRRRAPVRPRRAPARRHRRDARDGLRAARASLGRPAPSATATSSLGPQLSRGDRRAPPFAACCT